MGRAKERQPANQLTGHLTRRKSNENKPPASSLNQNYVITFNSNFDRYCKIYIKKHFLVHHYFYKHCCYISTQTLCFKKICLFLELKLSGWGS